MKETLQMVDRRTFLKIAGAAGAATLASACGLTEIRESCRPYDPKRWEDERGSAEINLRGMPLIPTEFTSKGSRKIIEEEIFPRFGFRNVWQLIQDCTYTENYVQTSFESSEGKIVINGTRDHYDNRKLDVDFTQKDTNSNYTFSILDNKAKIVNGEMATQKEANELLKRMPQFLVENFNNAAKNGIRGKVAYNRDLQLVTPTYKRTPTPTPAR